MNNVATKKNLQDPDGWNKLGEKPYFCLLISAEATIILQKVNASSMLKSFQTQNYIGNPLFHAR